MKPPSFAVDRWAGGSLTRRPKDPFAVAGQSSVEIKDVITVQLQSTFRGDNPTAMLLATLIMWLIYDGFVFFFVNDSESLFLC